MSELPSLVWRRSSYCSGGTCVEVALLGSRILIRDGKTEGPILSFQQAEWTAFLEGARRGEFNLPSDRP
jgi:hypothetical protein